MENTLTKYLFDGNGSPEISTLESAEDRALIMLAAIQEQCASDEEFVNFITENASTMEIYGLLPPEVATEASVKKVRSTFTRQSQLSRAEKLAALRLAKTNNDPNYAKFVKYKALMRAYEAKVLQKYSSKGKVIARKQLNGTYVAAKNIPGKQGAQMADKIDKAIKAADKDGRNGSAVNKKD